MSNVRASEWVIPTTRTWLCLSVTFAASCAPAHVTAYEPKKRVLDIEERAPTEGPNASSGSLWRDSQGMGTLFADARAFRADDIVVVRVEEVADAQRSSDTDVARSSRAAVGLSAVPLIGPLLPVLDPPINASAEGSAESQFRGGGLTERSERFVATVPTVVKQVLANGNLFIEGHRAILVNSEEHHLYVSGIVRPIDIDQENSIKSSQIAEAEIEFVGRGVVTDNQTQGPLTRFLGYFWPF